MNSTLKNILLIFLIVNALFWGLFDHSMHCQVASYFTSNCPSHNIHLTIGIICFVLAVYLKHFVH